MVQILPGVPSFGTQISRSLGTRFSKGLGQAAEFAQKMALEKSKRTAAKLKGFSNTFNKYLKGFKEDIPGQIDLPTREAMMLEARKLVEEQDIDPEEAIRQVWQKSILDQEQLAEFEDQQRESARGETFSEKFKRQLSPQVPLKNVGEAALRAGATMTGGAAGLVQFPLSVLSELGRYGRKGIYKAAGLSDEEIEEREKKFRSDIAAGEEATGIINPLAGTSLTEGLAKATGGRSMPRTGAQRILQGAVAGPEGILAAGAEEAAKGLGLPESVQAVTGLATFILAGRGQVGSKIGSFAKDSVKKAEKIADKVQSTPEAVLKDISEKAGVDMEKVNAGEGREIQKLNRALNETEQKTSKAFQESEKFSKVEAEKARKEAAEKLTQSPLEKYYEPTTKEPKTPEGKLAKEARQAPIKERRDRIILEIKDPAFLEKSPMEREAKLHELKEAEFELKWGKKPITQAELEAQIEKQHAEMREYITDPTASKVKKIQESIQKDLDAIKDAEKLIARGELPGPRVIDEFIKIHQEYLKGYEKLANELQEFVRKNKPIKGREAKVQRAQELENLVNRMAESAKAKIVNQVDKRKALGMLEKPSGAFLKNQLKDLFGDIQEFQKQVFKVNKVLSPESMKTAKIAKREIGKVPPKTEKVASDTKSTIENPTEKNIVKTAKEIGTSEENLGEFIQNVRSEAKEIAKEPTEKKAEAVAKKLYFPNFSKLAKNARNGIILGTVGVLAEEGLGFKIPRGILSGVGAAWGITGSSFTYGVQGKLQEIFDNQHADELRELRNKPEEFRAELKRLEKKYSKKRLNKIVKIMKEG